MFWSNYVIDPETGSLVTDTINEETHQVMKNISEVLKSLDMDFNNVVKCSIFMSNMNDYTIINEVYVSYFSDNHPLRNGTSFRSS